MNHEVISVESPRLASSLPKFPEELKRKTDFGNEGREATESGVYDGLLKQILIEIALEKIAAHNFGVNMSGST